VGIAAGHIGGLPVEELLLSLSGLSASVLAASLIARAHRVRTRLRPPTRDGRGRPAEGD
jgi:hypothetical protein